MLGLGDAPDLFGKKTATAAVDLGGSGGFDFDDDFEKMLSGACLRSYFAGCLC
jgi:hypothetical protein